MSLLNPQKQQQFSGYQKYFCQQQVIEFLENNGFQFQQMIGQRSQGTVVQAYSQLHKQKVAIKIFNEYREFDQEKQILNKLKGEKYVIQMIDEIQSSSINALVLELQDCDLQKILSLNSLSYDQVLILTHSMLRALVTLQTYGIIHSDIKPDNILYNISRNEFLLSDLGLSYAIRNPYSEETNKSLFGNDSFKSPEVLKGEKPYSNKVDVFSMGILILLALLKDTLNPLQIYQLKFQPLEIAVPSISDHPNYDFIQEIICNMINTETKMRLQPMNLFQKFNSLYQVNNQCLKNLVLPEKQISEQIQPFQEKFHQLLDSLHGSHLGLIPFCPSQNKENIFPSQESFNPFQESQNSQFYDYKDESSLKSESSIIKLIDNIQQKENKPLAQFQKSPDQNLQKAQDIYFNFQEKKKDKLWTEAYKLILKISQIEPKNSNYLIELGQIQYQLKLYKEAIISFQRYLQLDPQNQSCYEFLANSFKKINMLDEAIKQYQICLKINPKSEKILNSLGNIYFEKGMIDEAFQQYQRCFQINQYNYICILNLGCVYLKKGMADEAIQQYKICLQINPKYYICFYNLGQAYYKKGMVDEAIQQYNRYLQINPKHVKSLNKLGIAYSDKGMIDESIQQYYKCLEINPQNEECLNCLGLAYSKKGMVDKAIKYYQKCLQINPKIDTCLYNLGNAYYKKGMLDEAIQQYQKCLEINPKHDKCLNSLGVAYTEKGMYDEVIKYYQRGLQINPKNHSCLFNLGLAYCNKGMLNEAIQSQQILQQFNYEKKEFQELSKRINLLKDQQQLNLIN